MRLGIVHCNAYKASPDVVNKTFVRGLSSGNLNHSPPVLSFLGPQKYGTWRTSTWSLPRPKLRNWSLFTEFTRLCSVFHNREGAVECPSQRNRIPVFEPEELSGLAAWARGK